VNKNNDFVDNAEHRTPYCYLTAFQSKLTDAEMSGCDLEEICEQLWKDRRGDGINQEVKRWAL